MGESGVCYICHEDCVVARIPCPAGGTCKNPICIDCVAGWARTGYGCMICRQSLSGVRAVQVEFGHSVPRSASDAEALAFVLCPILLVIGVALSITVVVILDTLT